MEFLIAGGATTVGVAIVYLLPKWVRHASARRAKSNMPTDLRQKPYAQSPLRYR